MIVNETRKLTCSFPQGLIEIAQIDGNKKVDFRMEDNSTETKIVITMTFEEAREFQTKLESFLNKFFN